MNVPPRYRVKFPTGERELDAPELLDAYWRHEVNFSTLIAPVGAEQFRRLDADPEFQPLRQRLYHRQKAYFSPWTPLAVFWWFPVAAVLLPLLFPWGMIRWLLVLIGWYLTIMLPMLPEYSVLLPTPQLRKRFPGIYTLWIPYWNGITGFRIFRRLAGDLPERRRTAAHWLNPLFWGLWELFLAGGVFFPGGTGGGIALGSVFVLTVLCAAGLCATFRIGTAERYRRWKLENPQPQKLPGKTVKWYQFSNDFPPPPPQWAKMDFRTSLKNLLPGLACLAASAAVFLLPYYLDGAIRYHREMAHLPYRVVDTPPVPVMPFPEPPESADDFLNVSPWAGEMPEKVKSELRAQLPPLAEFRKQLRNFKVPPDGTLYPGEDQSVSGYRSYLRWRQLEYRMTAPSERPKSAEEIFLDFDARDQSQHRGTITALLMIPAWNSARLRLLEAELSRLPEARLRKEKAFFSAGERRLDERVRKVEYLFFLQFRNSMFDDTIIRHGYSPFSRGLRATQLRLNRQGIAAMALDFCDGKPHWEALDRHRRDVLILALTNWTSLGEYVSRQRAVSRLAVAAIDLELYRRQHGTYPENPQLPRDPFDGRPLRFLPGKMLYSVNSDCIDDGGRRERRFSGDSTDLSVQLTVPPPAEAEP